MLLPTAAAVGVTSGQVQILVPFAAHLPPTNKVT
jgi:hypothetical protein